MKVNIWIKREEVKEVIETLTLTSYYVTEPVSNLKDPDKHKTEYVQVTITADEFVRLEDRLAENIKNKWLVNQYNRNREHVDQVNSIKDIDRNTA